MPSASAVGAGPGVPEPQPWTVREMLRLASAVMKIGEGDWNATSKLLRSCSDGLRPVDFYSQRNCAQQYTALLDTLEAKQQRRRGTVYESPASQLVCSLTLQRMDELKRIIAAEQQQFRRMKREIDQMVNGNLDDEMMQHMLEQSRREDIAAGRRDDDPEYLEFLNSGASRRAAAHAAQLKFEEEAKLAAMAEADSMNMTSPSKMTSVSPATSPGGVFASPKTSQGPTDEQRVLMVSLDKEDVLKRQRLESEEDNQPLAQLVPGGSHSPHIQKETPKIVPKFETGDDNNMSKEMRNPSKAGSSAVRGSTRSRRSSNLLGASKKEKREEETISTAARSSPRKRHSTEENTTNIKEEGAGVVDVTQPDAPRTSRRSSPVKGETRRSQKRDSLQPEPIPKLTIRREPDGGATVVSPRKLLSNRDSFEGKRTPSMQGTPRSSRTSSPTTKSTVTGDFAKLDDYRRWKHRVMSLHRVISGHRHANVFMAPVTENMAPGYHRVVKQPMDLTLLRRMVEHGEITTTITYKRNLMLMFVNAVMYNSWVHDVHCMAKEMAEEVMVTFEQMMNPKNDDKSAAEMAKSRRSHRFQTPETGPINETG